MANYRLYVVNIETREYICIAKCTHYSWSLGNVRLLKNFLGDISGLDENMNLIFGNECDDVFYEKWIKDGINVNEKNTWFYA